MCKYQDGVNDSYPEEFPTDLSVHDANKINNRAFGKTYLGID